VIAVTDICVTKPRGRSPQRVIRDIFGNMLFMLFGGLGMFCAYLVLAMLLGASFVGQALAKEILRHSVFVLVPLGRDIRINSTRATESDQKFPFGTRLLYKILLGFPLALFHYYFAAICILGTITIPLAPKHIDMARAIADPFNKEVALLWGDQQKAMWEIEKEGAPDTGDAEMEETPKVSDGHKKSASDGGAARGAAAASPAATGKDGAR